MLLSLTSEITFAEVSELLRVAQESGTQCGFIDSWRGSAAAQRHAGAIHSWTSERPAGITFWNGEATASGLPGQFGGLEIVAHDAERPGPALAAARRTMALLTHGNGADAPFGDGLLCGRLTMAPSDVLADYLPCGQGGPCVRSRPVDGELREPELTATRDLGGDIVFWGTCYGALMADSVFDPRGGLLAGLLERPTGAPQVITTIRAAEIDDLEVLAACARVEAGQPLGAVVAALNEAYLSGAPAGTLPPWILFGDPRKSLPMPGSVSEVGSGSTVSAGLHLYRRPAEHESAPVVVVEQRPAEASAPGAVADLWLRPLAGGTQALLLRRDAGAAVRVDDVRPTGSELAVLLREIGAVDRLTFTDMFFQLAQMHPANAAFRYPESTTERVRATLGYLSTLQLSLRPLIALSGDLDSYRAQLAQETENWRVLNDELFGCLSGVLRHVGGVIHHHYAYMPLAPERSSVRACPLCGSPAEYDVYQLPSRATARAVVRCGRCTVVSDADAAFESVLLYGPDEVTAGQSADFTIRCGALPAGGVQHARAGLFVQPTPWPFGDQGTEAVATDVDDDLALALSWRPPADARPGRYFLLAPMVADGAVLVARKSVRVVRATG
ncbi:hypothetical protein [Kitasatospora viridis]|uniref:hypothetical protein n=1 Tax=Kitasatospora viridis TaxID=281105 RepID=UPI001478833A|nr:hypothetical protein [Kitasatospora viridis]